MFRIFVSVKKQTVMPTLFILFGLRFLFYSNDHEPIHIHVVKGQGRGKCEAKFNLLPELSMIENHGLKAQEVKIAEMVIEENKEIIIERWKEFFGK